MLKKTITYTDYNNTQRTEDFYFNISKAELMEMEMGTTGGMNELLSKILSAQDTPNMIKIFKEFLLKAYGEKSLDGKHFNKSEEISTAFSHTEAYSQLFTELAVNDVAAAEFVNGTIQINNGQQSAIPHITQITPTPAIAPITNL